MCALGATYISSSRRADAGAFYAVFLGVFRELDAQEQTAKRGGGGGGAAAARPSFGGAGAAEDSVTAFYAHWLNFATRRSDKAFAKFDKWDLNDAPSRVMRRLMHEKNRAARETARRTFNDAVRQLATWVKSHDPRPCGPVDVVAADEGGGGGAAAAAHEAAATAARSAAAAAPQPSFHCAACNKSYKNAQQLSNHENSGKHKQAVAKLRKAVREDDELKDMEELVIDSDGGDDDFDGADNAAAASSGGGKGGKKKKKKKEDAAAAAAVDGDGDEDGDEDDAAIEAAISIALPDERLVARQVTAAFDHPLRATTDFTAW